MPALHTPPLSVQSAKSAVQTNLKLMTPEKFFDYLEGKLPPAERERLERALISDPELQRQFVAARQIHRTMERPPDESAATTRAGSRGRQIAAAFAVLVAMNVALGLFYIFRSNQPSVAVRKAQQEKIYREVHGSVEKAAAAAFTPPTLGREQIVIVVPREKQDTIAQSIVHAATQAGGSGSKDLPNDGVVKVLVLVPASSEAQFRQTLHTLGAPAPSSSAPTPNTASPNEPVHLEIVLSSPR